MDEVIRHFVVTGKVQGVSFRQSARLEAQRLGIRGSARNLPDGSVEVWAQGSAAAVDELHRWLKRGPVHARVHTVRESHAALAVQAGALQSGTVQSGTVQPEIPEDFAVF